MKTLASLLVFCSLLAEAQTWQTGPWCPVQAGTMHLLRDGRVFTYEDGSTQPPAILKPDAFGSYLNGTWSFAASLPSGYAPHSYSSAVLPDGRLIFEGAEYNNGIQDWSPLGAIYDPVANTWTSVDPPTGWRTIGDAPSVVLPGGTFMQANCCTWQTALLDAKTLTWTPGGQVVTVNNNEEGWALLPNGKVLVVNSETACGTNMSTALYDPATNAWTCDAQLPLQLWGKDQELGSTLVTDNGKVIQFGGAVSATAVLDLASDTWALGPQPPDGYGQDDGPSVLEPNGKVLAMLGINAVKSCQFVEYDPVANTLSLAPNPVECPYQGYDSVSGRLLGLPNGQILFSLASHRPEIFTPLGGVVQNAAPYIYSAALRLYPGSANNILFGRQLNGLSCGEGYGDDAQMCTNYPLVRLVDPFGRVWFARTHDDSYSGIAPGTVSYTKFDLPPMPLGVYSMTVVTNGIQSNSVRVTVAMSNQE
jgi:hypothetical protein